LEQNLKFVKINIMYGGDKEENNVVISSMNVNADGERIFINGEDFGLIPHHSVVDAVGYFEDGLVIMSGKVSLSTESQINLNIIKTDDKKNRRKFIRVKLYKKTRLVKAYFLGQIKKSYFIDELIETRDVNLGGIGFYSNKRLLEKQKISLDFGFLKTGFEVEAEILRIEKGSFGSGYKYKYGCTFLNKNNEEERMICEYVFRVQIENHNKAMKAKECFEREE